MDGRLQQAAQDGENARRSAAIDTEGIRQIHGSTTAFVLVILNSICCHILLREIFGNTSTFEKRGKLFCQQME